MKPGRTKAAGSRCANPVLEYLLEGLAEEAREQGKDRLCSSYRKALASVRKYPLPITNGTEASQLEGVGPFIAKRLDELLAQVVPSNKSRHCQQPPRGRGALCDDATENRKRPRPPSPPLPPSELPSGAEGNLSPRHATKRARTDSSSNGNVTSDNSRSYSPRAGSGPQLLLAAFASLEERQPQGQYSKSELLEALASSSPVAGQRTKEKLEALFPKALRTLIQKSLVRRCGGGTPALYSLTPAGHQVSSSFGGARPPSHPLRDITNLAPVAASPASAPFRGEPSATRDTPALDKKECSTLPALFLPPPPVSASRPAPAPAAIPRDREDNTHRQDTACSTNATADDAEPSLYDFEPVRLEKDDFDVVLLLDNREVSTKRDRSFLHDKLVKAGVRCEVRSLSLGDVLWIARVKADAPILRTRPHLSGKEFVLDLILERKKLSDLWASIKDGRYYEQKVVYLVEGTHDDAQPHWRHKYSENDAVPMATLETALATTQIVDGFYVHRTATTGQSLRYLRLLTEQLTSGTRRVLARGRTEWARWNDSAGKLANRTVGDVFAMQLMAFPGLSATKAKAIVGRWGTAAGMSQALRKAEQEGEGTSRDAKGELSSLQCGGRRLGPVLAQKLVRFYCD